MKRVLEVKSVVRRYLADSAVPLMLMLM